MSLLKVTSFIILAVPVLAAAEKDFVDYELALESKDYESHRARFKFYDAAEGCPSHNDLPEGSFQPYVGVGADWNTFFNTDVNDDWLVNVDLR